MNDYIIVVVNTTGRLRMLYCPFRVVCIKAVGIIPKGTSVWVERVTMSPDHKKLLYEICAAQYLYECFAIQIYF
jgi:hypothetical protein